MRDLLLSIDESLRVAWQKGDAKKLDSLIDWNARFIDGAAAGADQSLDKARFLAKAKSVHLPKTVVAGNRAVRMSGGDPSDTTLITGILKDSANPADGGTPYAAVYLRTYLPAAEALAADPKTWVLVLFQTSPQGGKPQYAASPAVPWSLDDFAPSQGRVVKLVLDHLDSLLQKDGDALAKTVSDDFTDVHAFLPVTTRGKAELLAQLAATQRSPMPQGLTPVHVIGLEKPDIKILGVYSQTAVVTAFARHASGGTAYGSDDFKPQWRSAVYDTFVLVKPHRADWEIVYHQSTAVIP